MLTASTEEDKASISGEEMLPLSAKDACAVLIIPLKKGDRNEEGKQLKTLSSMMQDCYRYCTACTRQAQSPSNDLRKCAIADCFECYM